MSELKRRLREPKLMAADALWQRIEERRAAAGGGFEWRRRPRLLAAGLCLACALIAGYRLRRDASSLTWRDGGALASVQTSAVGRTLVFSDGSRAELAPNTRLVPLTVSDGVFDSELVYGRVVFDVVPHGPRRWTVHAADVQVSVLGTRFSVERTGPGVQVSVERGLVSVSQGADASGARRLAAGQAFVRGPVSTPPTAAASAAQPTAAMKAAPPAQAPPSSGREPAATNPGVARARPAVSTSAAPVTVDDLLSRADAARRADRPELAARLFRQINELHADDPRAALAVFTLGQLYLDALEQPALAAAAFARAQALGLPRALEDEAAARTVEAYARAGELARAHAAAREYLAHFPDGNRRRQVEAWARPQ